MPKVKPENQKNRFQLRREELNLSVKELSQKTKISISTIYRIEDFKYSDININNLIKIANVLKISPDYLLKLSDDKKLAQPIFPTNIHHQIMGKVRDSLKAGETVFHFAETHPKLPILYSKRWYQENANYKSLLKFTNYFKCSITELISVPAEIKIKELQHEQNYVQSVIENFK